MTTKRKPESRIGTNNLLPHFKFDTNFEVREKLVEKEVKVKGKGECFGYDGLMNKMKRTSTTVALTDVICFLLNEEDFDKTINV